MAKIRVLVVDDEPAILRFLKPALEANNYLLMSAGTVAEAIKRIAADTPDIVVLDLGLPDGDGKDVIRQVRTWSDVPIIVLSARDREAEKIEALDLGSDDFVNKPFGVGELLARMRTALRHRMERAAETPVLRTANLEIDNVRHRVCAVERRRFPVGARPTRQPLQPEATGAVMEETKWLKPSVSVSRIGDSASVQAVTRVNAEQASKRTMRRPTRRPFRGRLIRLGEAERRVRPAAAPG